MESQKRKYKKRDKSSNTKTEPLVDDVTTKILSAEEYERLSKIEYLLKELFIKQRETAARRKVEVKDDPVVAQLRKLVGM